ncbi:accessory gene regulator B family protein [Paenibacillus ehimensis]|uniref:accessory gene regulator B family protein n=1 Tax=Paenibacillus ehimensis TaxID=79264 RepID=UPI003D2B3E06
MRIVESVAERVAIYISDQPGSSSVAVLKYGLVTLINFILTILIVLSITTITGDLISGLIAIIGFPILRYVTGGLHLKSAILCNLVTSFFMLLSVYLYIDYWYNGFILTLISMLILFIFAPSGIKRSNLGRQYYPLLKISAVLIVGTNLLFQSHVLALVFFIQALTTASFSINFVKKLNL